MGYQRRFKALVEKACEIVRGGELGKPVEVSIMWALLKVIPGEEHPRISGEDAQRSLEVILASQRCGETGRPVRLVGGVSEGGRQEGRGGFVGAAISSTQETKLAGILPRPRIASSSAGQSWKEVRSP